MSIRKELLDEPLKDYQKPEDVIGENGILKQLTKAIIERALGAELTAYLGYPPHAAEGKNTGNSRNGTLCRFNVKRNSPECFLSTH